MWEMWHRIHRLCKYFDYIAPQKSTYKTPRESWVSMLVAIRNSNYAIYMIPIWMVFFFLFSTVLFSGYTRMFEYVLMSLYIHTGEREKEREMMCVYIYVLKCASLKLLSFQADVEYINFWNDCFLFLNRKCTHHSAHMLRTLIYRYHIWNEDCPKLHRLSNWNDYVALCSFFDFVFFALSLSKWILYNNFVHQCSAFPFPNVSKKVVFFSLEMNSNGNVVIAVIPTMLYAMSLLWCKRQNLFVVNKTRFHVYYSIDKLVIVVDNFM